MISERDIERWFESPHYRKKSDWICIDQPKVISEWQSKKMIGQLVMADSVQKLSWMKDIPTLEVSLNWLMKITGKSSHRGVMIIIERPTYKISTLIKTKRLVILDGIQDPGNLGTIIRSMVAFNCLSLGLTDDCVDPFHAKAVSASAGAISKVSIFYESHWAQFLKETSIPIYMLNPLANKTILDIKKSNEYILICGSEGNGIQSDVIKSVSAIPLAIPMVGEVESLNVGISASIALNRFTTG